MTYLVTASEGPGFSSPEEGAELLQDSILPTFEALKRLEAEKKILAGGLPVGERAFVFILQAASNEEVDQTLRSLPAWGLFKWEVIPLESFEGRASQDRRILKEVTGKRA